MVCSANPAAWALAFITAVAASVTIAITGQSFEWLSAAPPILACSILVPLAYFYRSHRPDPRLATVLMSCAQLVGFSACAALLSYALASLDRPIWDDAFIRWDQAFGLDWRSYFAFVEDHAWLATIYNLAYKSLIFQIIGLTLLLGMTGRLQASCKFVLSVMIAGITTVVVSAFMPAMTVYAHLGIDPTSLHHVDAGAALAHVAQLSGVRSGTIRLVSLRTAEGIVAFPSFHAALGVIFIAAFWHLPSGRWLGVVLNAVMIAATPVCGGHYFSDVAAGIFVAIAAIHLSNYLERRTAAPSSMDVDRSLSPAQLSRA